MQLGIFAKTFAGSEPATVLTAASQAGFSCVQYNMACSGLPALPRSISAEVAAAVKAASQTTGVTIAAVSATYNMAHPDLNSRLQGRQAFAQIAARAQAMGTRLVTLCTGSLNAADQWQGHRDNGSPQAWKIMRAEFDAILPLAEAHDLILGIEPERANIVNSAKKAATLLRELNSDRIGIILDPANLFEAADAGQRQKIIYDAIALLGPHLVMAHAKDRKLDGQFAAAGQGCVDFDAFLTALTEQGFTGPIITHGCTAEEAPGVAAFLAQQLAELGQHP